MSDVLRVCTIGDIMGRAGRSCLEKHLPRVQEVYQPHLIVANGENAAGGFGITMKIFDSFVKDLKINVVTTGNHWHDNSEVQLLLGKKPNILVPANMFNVSNMENGLFIGEKNGVSYAVINLLGRVFMKGANRCPFETFSKLEALIPPHVKVRIVDFHAETSSEKQAFAHYVKGRVSLLYGTHTHCQTADERIFADFTGYITDVGMTGAYDSVIGVITEASLNRFLGLEFKKFEPASDDPWFCALIADIDANSGRCLKVERLRYDDRSY